MLLNRVKPDGNADWRHNRRAENSRPAKKEVESVVIRLKDHSMNVDEATRASVAEWVRQGLKLSEIQNRLAEAGARLTYMEVRLLVDDLKLTPRDPETPRTTPTTIAGAADASTPAPAAAAPPSAGPKPASVSVTVDQLARPGALVSGKVNFTDGHKADWYLDQSGRLGLVADQPGYRPSAADVQQFQTALDAELSKMGF